MLIFYKAEESKNFLHSWVFKVYKDYTKTIKHLMFKAVFKCLDNHNF